MESNQKITVSDFDDTEQVDVYELFLLALKSPVTKQKYLKRLEMFLNFLNIPGQGISERINYLAKKGEDDNRWFFNGILKFLLFHKKRLDNKEIAAGTLHNYLKPIKLLCEISDISVKWKKLTRGLPRGRNAANDRAPTIEEIRKIMQYPDRRIKAIVTTMCSSGIRLGAWDYLKWGHIIPMEVDGQIVAAKMKVYTGEEDEYFTFISLEAYRYLKEWIDFRQKSGEHITTESWLMRNLWEVTTPSGGPKGLSTSPVKLQSLGIKRLMERAIWAQGLRTKQQSNKKRYEFQADHGLRKWFKTRCEVSGMKSINAEVLMGHSIGISDSYYKITEEDLLKDYLKAVDFLTIGKENRKQKCENENSVNERVNQKDEEIKKLREEYELAIKSIKNEMEIKFQEIISQIDLSRM